MTVPFEVDVSTCSTDRDSARCDISRICCVTFPLDSDCISAGITARSSSCWVSDQRGMSNYTDVIGTVTRASSLTRFEASPRGVGKQCRGRVCVNALAPTKPLRRGSIQEGFMPPGSYSHRYFSGCRHLNYEDDPWLARWDHVVVSSSALPDFKAMRPPKMPTRQITAERPPHHTSTWPSEPNFRAITPPQKPTRQITVERVDDIMRSS
jgi:hypothetical protein